VSDEHTPIYDRIGRLEIGCGRMDERVITLEKNHEDVKKGLRAIESQNAKNIKIIMLGIALITAIVNGIIKLM